MRLFPENAAVSADENTCTKNVTFLMNAKTIKMRHMIRKLVTSSSSTREEQIEKAATKMPFSPLKMSNLQ